MPRKLEPTQHRVIKLPDVIPWGLSAAPPGLDSNGVCPVPPRRVHCRFYDDCLDIALRQAWPSWRCPDRCPQAAAYGTEQLVADMIGLAGIVEAVFTPESLWRRRPGRLEVFDE